MRSKRDMANGPISSGVNVGGGSSTGRVLFALAGGLAGAYYGFYLQSKYFEAKRVHDIVEEEAQKRWHQMKEARGECE